MNEIPRFMIAAPSSGSGKTLLTCGIMRLLQKEGYRVPEAVQLIGFDGIRKFGGSKEDLFVSSMCQPLPQLAAKCVEIITTEDRSMIPSLTLLPVTFEDGGTTRSLKKG